MATPHSKPARLRMVESYTQRYEKTRVQILIQAKSATTVLAHSPVRENLERRSIRTISPLSGGTQKLKKERALKSKGAAPIGGNGCRLSNAGLGGILMALRTRIFIQP